MSNIFERNPTYTLLIVIVTVMTATWGVLTVILEDNKINFYKAQVESIKAECENIKSTASQYQARIEHLEKENEKLNELNNNYLEWISQSGSPLPFFKKRVEELTSEKLLLMKVTNASHEVNFDSSRFAGQEAGPNKYKVTKDIDRSSAFLDEKTGLIVGVTDINVDYEATLQVSFPDNTVKNEKVKVGKVYNFNLDGHKYQLIVKKVEFIYGYVSIQIIEKGLPS